MAQHYYIPTALQICTCLNPNEWIPHQIQHLLYELYNEAIIIEKLLNICDYKMRLLLNMILYQNIISIETPFLKKCDHEFMTMNYDCPACHHPSKHKMFTQY